MSDNTTRVCGGGALNTELASDHVAPRAAPRGVVIVKRDGAWQVAGEYGTVTLDGKRPGLQGPIDDAFTEPFLCVRGTGKPWNPAVQSCADASLARFAYEWNRYFRGELPVKDDTAVTDDDLRSRHLILFGDPGSNSLISKTLPRLPLKWTRDSVRFAGEDHSAADHLPALIRPNPLATAGDRYVVLNSGHTFRESELARLNYLLFPRWGDWAILKVGARVPQNPSDPLEETVVRAGYFDEAWRPK